MKKQLILISSILLSLLYCSSCISQTTTNHNMVFVRGGTFSMGCTTEQASDCDESEKPIHQVTLSDYYIGKYEVTVQEFKAFVDATNYQTDADKEGWSLVWDGKGMTTKNLVNWKCDTEGNRLSPSEYKRPVIHVSSSDAIAYCKWLSQNTGKDYRLPTEAEWEYAARGGNLSKRYKYAGSNNLDEVAWHLDNSGGKIHLVGYKKANELGLYDMSGNVWEWCQDWEGDYKDQPQTNPTGSESDSSCCRIFRGGSWGHGAESCRVSNRSYISPWVSTYNIGFRLAL